MLATAAEVQRRWTGIMRGSSGSAGASLPSHHRLALSFICCHRRRCSSAAASMHCCSPRTFASISSIDSGGTAAVLGPSLSPDPSASLPHVRVHHHAALGVVCGEEEGEHDGSGSAVDRWEALEEVECDVGALHHQRTAVVDALGQVVLQRTADDLAARAVCSAQGGRRRVPHAVDGRCGQRGVQGAAEAVHGGRLDDGGHVESVGQLPGQDALRHRRAAREQDEQRHAALAEAPHEAPAVDDERALPCGGQGCGDAVLYHGLQLSAVQVQPAVVHAALLQQQSQVDAQRRRQQSERQPAREEVAREDVVVRAGVHALLQSAVLRRVVHPNFDIIIA